MNEYGLLVEWKEQEHPEVHPDKPVPVELCPLALYKTWASTVTDRRLTA